MLNQNIESYRQFIPMQTQTEENPQKGLVTEWFPEKGFGFVAIGGKRIFVHVSDINPWHERGINLKGKTLVVHSTEDSPKGRRVSCADTLEEYEKRETQREAKALKEALAKQEKLRVKAELQDFLLRNQTGCLEEVKKNPKAFFSAYLQTVLREGSYVINVTSDDKEVKVLSTEDNGLTVEASFSLWTCASCENSHLSVSISKDTEFPRVSFVTGGVFWAEHVSQGDPLKGVAMALYREDIRDKEEKRYAIQLAGVVKGLESAGISDLVDPQDVLAKWPTAGERDYFGGQHGAEQALKWLGQKRENLADSILSARVKDVGINAYNVTTGGGFVDKNKVDENNGWGTWVDEYTHYSWKPWAQEILSQVLATDKAAGFRLDLSTLVESAFNNHLKVEDERTLSRGCYREDSLYLGENKIRCVRKRIADWVRDFRKNPNSYINGWGSAPNVENLELAEKVTILSEKIKCRLLAKQQALVEKKRLEDVTNVRKNWRDMLTWSHRSLSRSGLHQDALNLLEKIRVAQNRAGDLAGPRRWEMERRSYELLEQARREAEEEAIRKKEEESEQFLSQGAWSALDKFGFK